MKRHITILILCLLSLEGFSTHQVEDYLIYNSDTLFFYDSPLEQIDSISWKIYQINKSGYISSDCHRGFYAEWKLIDSTLYLSKVFDCENDKVINYTIEKILNRKFDNGLLKADWVNGCLWCGNDIVWERTLYLSVYRHEIKLNIEKGKLLNINIYDFIPCDIVDEKQVNEFVIKNLDWTTLPPLDDKEIIIDTEITINRKGKVINVIVKKSNNDKYNIQIINILKQLPCRTVFFREGKVLYDNKDWITINIDKESKEKYVR